MLLVQRRMPRYGGQRRRSDGNAKEPDWEIHQPECEIQPRHCAGPFARCEHSVDEDVHLSGSESDRTRAHEDEHACEAFIPPIENRAVCEAFAPQRGPLDCELGSPAQ